MRLRLRIIMPIVLGALALSVAGCQKAPWTLANEPLAQVAQNLADRAARRDIDYFMGVSPARERVPDLMEQVARSGIATNYAEHLVIQSASSASLVYGLRGETGGGASFVVQLSLVDGKPRVDQIVDYATVEQAAAGSPTETTEPSAEEGAVLPADGAATVAVTLPSGKLSAGSEQAAIVGYTNTSAESTSVPQSIGVTLRVTDELNHTISTWTPDEAAAPAGDTFLAPSATVYRVVRFEAPEPGSYILYGSANGLQAPAVYFETGYSK